MYSAIGVLTPPTVEPVSVDLARQHCRIDHSSDDVLLARYLRTARGRAERFLGRALITQTLRWVMRHEPPRGALPALPMAMMVWPLIESMPQLWDQQINLPRSPVQQVTNVVIMDRDGTTSTLVQGTDYTVDTLLEPARLRLCTVTYPVWVEHIEIDFVAGYGATGDAVPDEVITAILMLTAWLYENRGDAAAEMPDAVQALLWPLRVVYFGG